MKNTRTIRHLLSWLGFATALCLAPFAVAADAPSSGTPAVLAKIHEANQKEIQMGKMAEQKGKSKDVIAYAKMIVKDHTAADQKVLAFAKKQKIELPAVAAPDQDEHSAAMEKGSDVDVHFAQGMLDDHKKTIADLTQVRESTDDAKLKALIGELLPTLKKHEAAAQKLVDKAKL